MARSREPWGTVRGRSPSQWPATPAWAANWPFASEILVVAARMAVAQPITPSRCASSAEAVAIGDTVGLRASNRPGSTSTSCHYEQSRLVTSRRRRLTGRVRGLEIAAWSSHYQRHFAGALALADRGATRGHRPGGADELPGPCRLGSRWPLTTWPGLWEPVSNRP